MIDDYRILWIAEPSHRGNDASLVLWDTSGLQPQQVMFEMPSGKEDVAYVPERFMSSASVQRSVGLHRADPNQQIIGVVCQGSHGDIRLDDDYMIIISAADLCAHASSRATEEIKIQWKRWKPSATVVRINLSITAVVRISGSRFFAVVRGVSYTAYAILLRVYDFSPGARGRRYPDRPLVRDLIVNAGRVLKKVDNAIWELSEDNLVMFNVSTE